VTGLGAPKTNWQLYVHPAFSKPFNALTDEVERLAAADPKGYVEHPKAKLLRRIVDLIESEIPRDPGAAEYAGQHTGTRAPALAARQVPRSLPPVLPL
jgi:Toxin with endonuclease activity, of toxin-antitoxin system